MIEHIKTTVLWILILLSVFLTYMIWTFQPDYAILRNTEYIDNPQIGVEKRMHEVIRPKQVVIYEEGSFYSPLDSREHTHNLYEEFLGVTIDQLTMTSSHYPLSNSDSLKGIEFIFPTNISFEQLKEMYQFTNQDQLLIKEIDRVIFFISTKDEKEQIVAQFVSFDEQIVVEAETTISVSKFKDDILMERFEHLHEVFRYDLIQYDDRFRKSVFLTKEEVYFTSITYLAKPIAPEQFKQSLFSDPNFVKHYLQSNGEESFTDGSRMVNILYSGSVLRYINPLFGEVIEGTTKSILASALDFLNGHGGFTNEYYYDSVKTIGNDEVTFRLFVDNMPVYQANFYQLNNLYEITLSRGSGSQIEKYVRPLFIVDDEPINITKSMRLASGYEVIEALKQIDEFNPYLLTDINIGFKMIKRQSFVIFEPYWFIHYNGSWLELEIEGDLEDSEALINGLE